MTMPEISSHVLLHLKRCAERQLGESVNDAKPDEITGVICSAAWFSACHTQSVQRVCAGCGGMW